MGNGERRNRVDLDNSLAWDHQQLAEAPRRVGDPEDELLVVVGSRVSNECGVASTAVTNDRTKNLIQRGSPNVGRGRKQNIPDIDPV
jgi:hypothetical protein